MPDSVRESLAPYYKNYLDLAEAGQKLPSKKQLRMMAALQAIRGSDQVDFLECSDVFAF